MANTYLDSVLAEDYQQQVSATTSPKRPFVAIGSQMWTIWRIVLQSKHGFHVESSTTAMILGLANLIFGSSHSTVSEGETFSNINETSPVSCEWQISVLPQGRFITNKKRS
jgi:hypothetical protein